jgi:hypothetical protein
MGGKPVEPVEGVDIEGLTRSSPILSLFAERSVAIALFIWVGELEPWLMRTLEGPLGERFGGEWLVTSLDLAFATAPSSLFPSQTAFVFGAKVGLTADIVEISGRS